MFCKVGKLLEEIPLEDVEVVNVSRRERIYTSSSSKGNQLKWKSNNRYIKLDMLGHEGVAEVLVSFFLGHTDLVLGRDYIEYFPCLIIEDGKKLGEGCYSYNFKKDGQSLISSGRLLKKAGLSFGIGKEDFIEFIGDILGYDVAKDYIDMILCVDSIIRNDDRHFYNISFVEEKGVLKPSPIYDNGCGCLSDCVSYPLNVDFMLNYNSIIAKPFDEKFEYQIGNCKRILVNKESFLNSVKVHSDKAIRALKTIEQGLSDTKGLSWEEV